MGVRVLIVEDELLLAEDISTDLTEFGFEIVGVFTSGEDCIKNLENLFPDVIIMDIRLRGEWDGIETAKRVNEIKKTPIVYLTSNSDKGTVERLLHVFPSSFISKPYQKTDLMMAIELAVRAKTVEENQNKSIFIRSANKYIKIAIADITYVEADGSYTKIHLATESHIVSFNLKYIEDAINDDNFKRIHRSYLINCQKVEGIKGSNLIVNKVVLPISKSYSKEVTALFKKA